MSTTPPVNPTVLVRIDRNSALSVLQDAGVQVVLLDERAIPDQVILVPRRDQYEEILHVLGGKSVLSPGHDDAIMTASNAIMMLFRQRLIVGALVPDAILTEIEIQQAAQR